MTARDLAAHTGSVRLLTTKDTIGAEGKPIVIMDSTDWVWETDERTAEERAEDEKVG